MANKKTGRGRQLVDLVLSSKPSSLGYEESLITPEDLGFQAECVSRTSSPSVLPPDLFNLDLNMIPLSPSRNYESINYQRESSDDEHTDEIRAATMITTLADIHRVEIPFQSTSLLNTNQEPKSPPTESMLRDYESDDSVNDPHWFPTPTKRRKIVTYSSSDSDELPLIRNLTSIENITSLADIETVNNLRPNPTKNKGNLVKKNKKARVLGESYLGFQKQGEKYTRSVIKQKKNILRRCSHTTTNTKSKHAFLCAQISDQERTMIHSYYWSLESWAEKKAFVRTSAVRREIRRRRKDRASTKKQAGHDIYLNKHDEKFTRVKVCRLFFLNTLNIGEDCFKRWVKESATPQIRTLEIETVTNNIDSPGFDPGNLNNLNESVPVQYTEKTLRVKNWLDLLPKVPSHYCRASSKKIYIESTFRSENHAHEVFIDWCKKQGYGTVSRPTFLKVLKKENIAIHHPRKDQCDVCCSFQAGNISQIEYDDHVKKQKEARNAKKNAKEFTDDKTVVITVDVQSVLLAPKLLASALYYKLKLQCHNFTVYNCKTKDVKIYFWHEVDGGVSANEFTSCVVDYLRNLPDVTEKVIIISDGCGHQNRNRILSSALSDLSQKTKLTIEQMYLEKGHTMMEVDSVHSTIEQYIKPPIYAPSDYIVRIKQARPSQPYNVKSVHYDFFLNYEELESNFKSIRPGKKKGDPVVQDIRGLKYSPDGSVSYKLRHTEDWMILPQRRTISGGLLLPKLLYNEPPKITESKFKHLQELKNVIDKDYHPFYDSIKFNPGT